MARGRAWLGVGNESIDVDAAQLFWTDGALHPLSSDGRGELFAELDGEPIDVHCPDLQRTLILDAAGALQLPDGTALPAELAQRPFRIELRARDAHGAEAQPAIAVLPVQLHAGSDVIVMFDRSRAMKAKWAAAREAASLFAELYGGALAPLQTAAGVRLLDEQRIAFGHFDVHERCPRTVIAPLRPASGEAPRLVEEVGEHGATLADALVTAQHFFGEGSRERRRHIVVLSGSCDSGHGRPLGELGPSAIPRVADDAARGVSIHCVIYGRAGEAHSAELCALSGRYGGRFHDSASEPDPLDPDELQAMFLSVLAGVLPIERLELRGGGALALEDGVRRAVFVAPSGADLCATRAGQALPRATLRNRGAFTFLTVDRPEAGEYRLSAAPDARVSVLLEAALRMRCGVRARGLGEPIELWVELAHGLTPVRGAVLHASAALPDESLGELLTEHAQAGSLPSGRGGHVDRELLARVEERDATGVRDQPRALQRSLLDAVERGRGQPFRTRRKSLVWVEVRPGRYEARLHAADVQHEGAYGFRISARGCTPAGHDFARTERVTTVLAPIPDPQRSAGWIEERAQPLPDGSRSWLATFRPCTRLGRPLGPGLAHTLSALYTDADAERGERLRALDNLDGTYSVPCTSRDAQPPAVVLHHRLAGAAEALAVLRVRDPAHGDAPGGPLGVRVILQALRIADPRDRCLVPNPQATQGAERSLELDALVAINGHPRRARRTRVSRTLPGPLDPQRAIELSALLFDGHVEPGAALVVTLGEPDFDWLEPRPRRPASIRHRQVFRLVAHGSGVRAVPLSSDPVLPGRRRWQVSLALQVEATTDR